MKQRLDYIDIAKGFGIILAVMNHTECYRMVSPFIAFTIPIFFFCSGYTSSSIKGYTMKENFWRHAVKLLKPYFFFSVLLLLIFHDFSLRAIVGIFYSRYCFYPFGSQPDIFNLMIIGNYPLWFLTCMVVAYFLYYLIIYNLKYQYHIALFYVILTIVLRNIPILLPWSIDTAFMMSLFMYAGNRARLFLPNLFQRRPHLIVIISAIVYIALIPLTCNINHSIREYGPSVLICIIGALSGSVVMVYISRFLENTLLGKVFQQIGNHSLAIFCIQIPFILIGKQIAEWIMGDITTNQTSLVITAIIQATTAIIGGYLTSIILHYNNKVKKFVF